MLLRLQQWLSMSIGREFWFVTSWMMDLPAAAADGYPPLSLRIDESIQEISVAIGPLRKTLLPLVTRRCSRF